MASFQSKKFTAAEKHFQGLLDKERKINKELRIALSAALDENRKLKAELVEREMLLADSHAQIEELNKTAGLTESEIRDLVEKSQRTGALLKTLTKIGGMW